MLTVLVPGRPVFIDLHLGIMSSEIVLMTSRVGSVRLLLYLLGDAVKARLPTSFNFFLGGAAEKFLLGLSICTRKQLRFSLWTPYIEC